MRSPLRQVVVAVFVTGTCGGLSSAKKTFRLVRHTFEPKRPAEDPHWHIRVGIRGLAARILSPRGSGVALARVLRPLLPGGRSRLDILQRAQSRGRAAVGRTHATAIPILLQTTAQYHACLPAAGLHRRAQRVPTRNGAPGRQTARYPDSVAPSVFPG